MSLLLSLNSSKKRTPSIPYTEIVLGTESGNLVAYWPLNETSGSVVVNLEGTTARNGTYVGSPTLANAFGPFKESLVSLFNGSTQFANIISESLKTALGVTRGTLMFWGKASTNVWGDAITQSTIDFRSNNNNELLLAGHSPSTAPNIIRVQFRRAGGASVIGNSPFSSLNWFQEILTWSNTDSIRQYVNSFLVYASPSNFVPWDAVFDRGRIAAAATASPANYWPGWFSHVAFWNKALSPKNVKTLYNNGPIL
jgi:hypothetical protein